MNMMLWQDVKYGVRMLARDKGFTAVMVTALALGIGANTTVFTLVNAVLFRGLPFDRPDQMMIVNSTEPAKNRDQVGVSYADFMDWKSRAKSFQDMAGIHVTGMVVADTSAAPERYSGVRLTTNTFGMIGQKPLLGRDFLPEEGRPGAAPVCILGYTLWETRYGRDPNILGRTVRIDEKAATIVGVMPKGMKFPTNGELWTPLIPTGTEPDKRDERRMQVAARLADGVTVEKARLEIEGIARNLAQQYPKTNEGIGAHVIPYNDAFNGGPIRVIFLALLGAVGFVLLIACANVANLLLARSLARSREISLRTALGAARWRVIRQLLVESVLVGILGGAVGLLIAIVGVRAFDAATADVGKPYWIVFRLDFTVFAYLAAICLFTGILFGLAPALQLSKVDLSGALKEGGRGSSGGARARYLSGALVVTEVALSIVLLVGAGLMIRSFLNMYGMTTGLQGDRFLVARLDLPEAKYPTDEARRRFAETLETRLAATPGVQTAVITTALPMTGTSGWKTELEGKPAVEENRLPEIISVITSPEYLQTIGIPVVRGRGFTRADGLPGNEVAVVNQLFVAKYFPGENPLGKRLRIHWKGERPWITIVGVNQDFPQTRTDFGDIEPIVYLPYRERPVAGYGLMLRTAVPPKTVASGLRAAIQAIDPDLPAFGVTTLEEQFQRQRWAFTVFGTLFTIFALIALLLSSVGLYAMMAYSVTRRTREIGVRIAMGASALDVMRLVMTQGVRQLAIGLIIGLAAAFGVARVLKSLLVKISPTDPTTFLTISVVLAAVGIFACWLPARTAMKVDPMEALRYE